MDEPLVAKSYSLFGVRVDTAKPQLAAMAIFEAAVTHLGIRVVLADLWTCLLAQQDFAVWESLSGADLVLPAGEDAVIRRLTRRRGVPTVESDKLIQDLLIALEKDQQSLVLVAPDAELSAIGLLLHRIWPTLQVTEIGLSASEQTAHAGERLLHTVNDVRPAVLLIGGCSPWQERWTFEQREQLQAGAVVLLPSLHTTLAAIGQRAGIKSTAPGWLRRRTTMRRALDVTLVPAAQASVRTLSTLLRVPGDTLRQSALAQWRLNPSNRRRPGGRRGADQRGVRVSEWHETDDSSLNLPAISPLARLGPPRVVAPRVPALPQPSGEVDLAEQPTIELSLSALQAAIQREVTGHIVPAPDESTAAQRPNHGAAASGQEFIVTGKIRDPNEPREPGASAAPDGAVNDQPDVRARRTTPLPHSDALAAPSGSGGAPAEPGAAAPIPPLAPTTKLRLPPALAPTTRLPRRAAALRGTNAANAGNDPRGGAPAPAPARDEAAVGVPSPGLSPAEEDSGTTAEVPAAAKAPVEELATAASLGNTPRRIVRRRRRVPPQRRKRHYQELG